MSISPAHKRVTKVRLVGSRLQGHGFKRAPEGHSISREICLGIKEEIVKFPINKINSLESKIQ
jgi:hypothetical protein